MVTINVGTTDKYIRYVLGVILIALGIYYIAVGSTVLGWVLVVVSLIPLVTAAFSTCPIYSMLGISTCSVKSNKA